MRKRCMQSWSWSRLSSDSLPSHASHASHSCPWPLQPATCYYSRLRLTCHLPCTDRPPTRGTRGPGGVGQGYWGNGTDSGSCSLRVCLPHNHMWPPLRALSTALRSCRQGQGGTDWAWWAVVVRKRHKEATTHASRNRRVLPLAIPTQIQNPIIQRDPRVTR
jgi:hypothetical protein